MWSEVGVNVAVVATSDDDWAGLRTLADRVSAVVRPLAKLNSVMVDWEEEANRRTGNVRFKVRNIV